MVGAAGGEQIDSGLACARAVRPGDDALFLVEQNARHASTLSDRAYAMVNGQIRPLSGSGQTLLNDPGA